MRDVRTVRELWVTVRGERGCNEGEGESRILLLLLAITLVVDQDGLKISHHPPPENSCPQMQDGEVDNGGGG